MNSPVADLFGVGGPLGVEIETHVELLLWMIWFNAAVNVAVMF